VRLVSWNIRAGGGKRIDAISRALTRWAPDVVVLSEFRGTAPSCVLAERLCRLGLTHQRSTADAQRPVVNALLVASRYPLRRLRTPPVEDRMRMLPVHIDAPHAPDLRLLAVHVPNRVTGRKYPFLDAVVQWAARPQNRATGIILGDTNSGLRGIDEESPAFNLIEETWFTRLAEAHWHDLYRRQNGARRAYTWYSPNGDNGFRLDQLFACESLSSRFEAMRYRWAGGSRRSGVSDHAAIIAELSP
jgi:exonuclease III